MDAMRTTGEALRALGASFAALVETRLQLALVELREEGERRKEHAMLAAAAGVLFTLAAQIFALLVVVVFWDTHRVAAAAGASLLYLALGLALLALLRRRANEAPQPFQATLAELARDREALGGHHE